MLKWQPDFWQIGAAAAMKYLWPALKKQYSWQAGKAIRLQSACILLS